MQGPVTILSPTQQPEIVDSNTFDTKLSLRTQTETGLFFRSQSWFKPAQNFKLICDWVKTSVAIWDRFGLRSLSFFHFPRVVSTICYQVDFRWQFETELLLGVKSQIRVLSEAWSQNRWVWDFPIWRTISTELPSCCPGVDDNFRRPYCYRRSILGQVRSQTLFFSYSAVGFRLGPATVLRRRSIDCPESCQFRLIARLACHSVFI